MVTATLADFMEMPTPDIARNNVRVTFTKYFPDEYKATVTERIKAVVNHFPEYWNRYIKVGIEGYWDNPTAAGHFISIGETGAYIRLQNNPTLNTIAHELMHGVQKIDPDVPNGEKSCDLFTLARNLRHMDTPPYYLDLPPSVKDEWYKWKEICHFVAKDAIAKRREGLRQYIKWFEQKIRNIFDETIIK
jgi:hypothetical protein